MKNKYFTLLLLVLVFIAVGCLKLPGGTVVNNQDLNNTQAQQQTINNKINDTGSQATSSSEGDISDWKIYENEKYKFSLSYPAKWFVIEENDSFTEQQFITFSNLPSRCGKGDCPLEYSAVFVRIYSNNSEAYNEYFDQKQKYEKISTTEENILSSGNNNISFYLISEMSEEPDETWDMIKPVAKAFFQDNEYSYVFYIATEIPQGSDGQKEEIDIMKKMLKTLRIDN